MNRRLVLYAVIDLLAWCAVAYLLSTEPVHQRLVFWYHATRSAQRAAERMGRVALACEDHYYRAVAL